MCLLVYSDMFPMVGCEECSFRSEHTHLITTPVCAPPSVGGMLTQSYSCTHMEMNRFCLPFKEDMHSTYSTWSCYCTLVHCMLKRFYLSVEYLISLSNFQRLYFVHVCTWWVCLLKVRVPLVGVSTEGEGTTGGCVY